MKRREKGTYGVLDKVVLAYAKRHRDASVSVLIALAERANFTRQPAMRVAEIMLETDLGQRAVEKCLAHLEAAGLAARRGNGWTYQQANDGANGGANDGANGGANDGANGGANDGANGGANSRSLGQPENAEQDGIPELLKEVEGSKKEREESKEQKDPPTPQGDEARDSTAPAAPEHQQEISGEQEQTLSPDGEAAGAAVTDLPAPSQASPAPLEGAKNDATSTKKVPGGAARRASRALAAAEFDPLTLALPEGVPEGAWADWCGHRREIRKPLTERAARLTLNALSTAAAQGWDAGQLIAEAITHGWTGCVFEKHRSPAPAPRHIVKFPARRPQTTEEANARFVSNMAANADAVRGVFDD